MKSKILALALTVASLGAAAVPALTPGPLYLKFNGFEQIAVSGSTGSAYGDSSEINWGVIVMDTITPGIFNPANQTVGTTANPAIFNNITNGQITGMFYGIHGLASGTGGNAFPATGGFLDLYYRDAGLISSNGVADLASSNASVRTGLNQAGDFTDGAFLVRLAFSSGINNASSSVFINGSQVPSFDGFSGLATSFANVVSGLGGLWEETLDTDGFTTNFGTRDFRFRNIYENDSTWNGDVSGCQTGGNCVLGANITDPAGAFAIPEPGSLALLGLGLVAAGAVRRRKSKL